jgi:tetratricopeptide (TPR) repeat protein
MNIRLLQIIFQSINAQVFLLYLALFLFTNFENLGAIESGKETSTILQVLGQVYDITSEIKDAYSKYRIVERTAKLAAKLEDKTTSRVIIKRVSEIADAIDDPIHRSIALKGISAVQEAMGDVESSKKTYAEALIDRETTDPTPSKEYNTNPEKLASHTIISMAKGGDIKGALKGAESLDEYEKPITLHYIVEAQAGSHDINGAPKTASTITIEYGYQARALERIIDFEMAVGDEKAAFVTVDAIQDVDEAAFRADALFNIARIQAKQGNKEAAVSTMHKAILSGGLKTYLPKLSYPKLTNLLAESNKLAKSANKNAAIITLKKAKNEIDNLSDKIGQSWALAELITAQVQAGDTNGALQSQKAFSSEGESFTNLSLPFIIKAQLDEKNFEGALRSAEILTMHSAFDKHDP